MLGSLGTFEFRLTLTLISLLGFLPEKRPRPTLVLSGGNVLFLFNVWLIFVPLFDYYYKSFNRFAKFLSFTKVDDFYGGSLSIRWSIFRSFLGLNLKESRGVDFLLDDLLLFLLLLVRLLSWDSSCSVSFTRSFCSLLILTSCDFNSSEFHVFFMILTKARLSLNWSNLEWFCVTIPSNIRRI